MENEPTVKMAVDTLRQPLGGKDFEKLSQEAQRLMDSAKRNYKLRRFLAAEQECAEALEKFRALAAATPEKYRPAVSGTLNNLAILHSELGRHAYAEQEYAEALETYRALAAATPEAFRPDVATTLNNLAILHSDLGRHAEAEQEYAEALEIRRALAAATPEAYRPDVATTLNNLALLHSDLGRHAYAEQEYAEALEIRRALAAATPEAYRPDVATTLNNLALLHSDLGRHAEAEQEYAEALETYRALAAATPEAYRPYVAGTLTNLALLHSKLERHDEAAKEASEALELYRALAKATPEVYRPRVAVVLRVLANSHSALGWNETAALEYAEAGKIGSIYTSVPSVGNSQSELLFEESESHFTDMTVVIFKAFEDFSMRGLRQFNLLVGENNMGKTTLLEALYCQTLMNDLPRFVELVRFRSRVGNEVSLQWVMEQVGDMSLSATFNGQKHSFSIVKEQTEETIDRRNYAGTLKNRSVSCGQVFESQMHIYTDEKGYQERYGKLARLCRSAITSPYRYNHDWLIAAHEVMLLDKRYRELMAFIRENVDDTIEDIQLVATPQGRRFIVTSTQLSKGIDLAQYGEGLQRIFEISLFIISCRGGCVMIDEVESGIHKRLVAPFIHFIDKLSVLCNVQVFATTHSREAVELIVENVPPQRLSVARLEREGDKIVAKQWKGEKVKSVFDNAEIDIR